MPKTRSSSKASVGVKTPSVAKRAREQNKRGCSNQPSESPGGGLVAFEDIQVKSELFDDILVQPVPFEDIQIKSEDAFSVEIQDDSSSLEVVSHEIKIEPSSSEPSHATEPCTSERSEPSSNSIMEEPGTRMTSVGAGDLISQCLSREDCMSGQPKYTCYVTFEKITKHLKFMQVLKGGDRKTKHEYASIPFTINNKCMLRMFVARSFLEVIPQFKLEATWHNVEMEYWPRCEPRKPAFKLTFHNQNDKAIYVTLPTYHEELMKFLSDGINFAVTTEQIREINDYCLHRYHEFFIHYVYSVTDNSVLITRKNGDRFNFERVFSHLHKSGQEVVNLAQRELTVTQLQIIVEHHKKDINVQRLENFVYSLTRGNTGQYYSKLENIDAIIKSHKCMLGDISMEMTHQSPPPPLVSSAPSVVTAPLTIVAVQPSVAPPVPSVSQPTFNSVSLPIINGFSQPVTAQDQQTPVMVQHPLPPLQPIPQLNPQPQQMPQVQQQPEQKPVLQVQPLERLLQEPSQLPRVSFNSRPTYSLQSQLPPQTLIQQLPQSSLNLQPRALTLELLQPRPTPKPQASSTQTRPPPPMQTHHQQSPESIVQQKQPAVATSVRSDPTTAQLAEPKVVAQAPRQSSGAQELVQCVFCKVKFPSLLSVEFYEHCITYHLPRMRGMLNACEVPRCKALFQSRFDQLEHLTYHVRQRVSEPLAEHGFKGALMNLVKVLKIKPDPLTGESNQPTTCPLCKWTVPALRTHLTLIHFFDELANGLQSMIGLEGYDCTFITCKLQNIHKRNILIHVGVQHGAALTLLDLAQRREGQEVLCPLKACARFESFNFKSHENLRYHLLYHYEYILKKEIISQQKAYYLTSTKCPFQQCTYDPVNSVFCDWLMHSQLLLRHYALEHKALMSALLSNNVDSQCLNSLVQKPGTLFDGQTTCLVCEKSGEKVYFCSQSALMLHLALEHFGEELQTLVPVYAKQPAESVLYCKKCLKKVFREDLLLHIGVYHNQAQNAYEGWHRKSQARAESSVPPKKTPMTENNNSVIVQEDRNKGSSRESVEPVKSQDNPSHTPQEIAESEKSQNASVNTVNSQISVEPGTSNIGSASCPQESAEAGKPQNSTTNHSSESIEPEQSQSGTKSPCSKSIEPEISQDTTKNSHQQSVEPERPNSDKSSPVPIEPKTAKTATTKTPPEPERDTVKASSKESKDARTGPAPSTRSVAVRTIFNKYRIWCETHQQQLRSLNLKSIRAYLLEASDWTETKVNLSVTNLRGFLFVLEQLTGERFLESDECKAILEEVSKKKEVAFVCKHCDREFSSLADLGQHVVSAELSSLDVECGLCDGSGFQTSGDWPEVSAALQLHVWSKEHFYNRSLSNIKSKDPYRKCKSSFLSFCDICSELLVDVNEHIESDKHKTSMEIVTDYISFCDKYEVNPVTCSVAHVIFYMALETALEAGSRYSCHQLLVTIDHIHDQVDNMSLICDDSVRKFLQCSKEKGWKARVACMTCPYASDSIEGLQAHLDAPGHKENTRPDNGSERLKCFGCTREFKTIYGLRLHEYDLCRFEKPLSPHEKDYFCKVCGVADEDEKHLTSDRHRMLASCADRYLKFCVDNAENPCTCSDSLLEEYLTATEQHFDDLQPTKDYLSQIHPGFKARHSKEPAESDIVEDSERETMEVRDEGNTANESVIEAQEAEARATENTAKTDDAGEGNKNNTASNQLEATSSTETDQAKACPVNCTAKATFPGKDVEDECVAEVSPKEDHRREESSSVEECIASSTSSYSDCLDEKEIQLVTVCPYCPATFQHGTQLLLHIHHKHETSPLQFLLNSYRAGRPVNCDVCTRKCSSPITLAVHRDRHQVKPFMKCPVCRQSYVSPCTYYSSDSCGANSMPEKTKTAVIAAIQSLTLQPDKSQPVGSAFTRNLCEAGKKCISQKPQEESQTPSVPPEENKSIQEWFKTHPQLKLKAIVKLTRLESHTIRSDMNPPSLGSSSPTPSRPQSRRSTSVASDPSSKSIKIEKSNQVSESEGESPMVMKRKLELPSTKKGSLLKKAKLSSTDSEDSDTFSLKLANMIGQPKSTFSHPSRSETAPPSSLEAQDWLSFFCLDCEKCSAKDCDHTSHPRVFIGNYSEVKKHVKRTKHGRLDLVSKFFNNKRVCLRAHDLAYSMKRGREFRNMFKKYVLKNEIRLQPFATRRQCKWKNCTYKSSNVKHLLRHLKSCHID